MELREAGPPAAGQRLLGAEAPGENALEAVAASRRSGGAGSTLRWFITGILCASFLGLVRAGLEPSRAGARAGVLQGMWSRLRCLQTV